MKAEPVASRGRGKRKQAGKLHKAAYDAAVNHAIGISSEPFIHLLDGATKKCDALALEAIARAFSDVKDYVPKENKINIHVRSCLIAFVQLDEELDRFPTRWEIREWVCEKLDDPYAEDSDWSYVWKESGLEFLAPGEPKPPEVFRRRRI